MKCAICGRPVTSGVVLHTECFERHLWHNAGEHPPVHTEFYEIDGDAYIDEAKRIRIRMKETGDGRAES